MFHKVSFSSAELGVFSGLQVSADSSDASSPIIGMDGVILPSIHRPRGPMPVVMIMETSDIDDGLALLTLLADARVTLKALVVSPGTNEQVGLVKAMLEPFGLSHIPIGKAGGKGGAESVSDPYRSAYRNFKPAKKGDIQDGGAVLKTYCDSSTTLVCGASPKVVSETIKKHGKSFEVGELVMQGGFAGKTVVPDEFQLDKFKDMTTCTSFNFGTNPKNMQAVLDHEQIGRVSLVSKNVCHRVEYGEELHNSFSSAIKSTVGELELYRVLEDYRTTHPEPKKMHDALMVMSLLQPEVLRSKEVNMVSEGKEWGASLPALKKNGKPEKTNTFISVGYDSSIWTSFFNGTKN
ncbi:hypothetical protein HOH87_02665 [bacterium]|jgi:inosine-uridine nucleoside N-ribohydrolase|nr:hypothetical protein [bacterium]